MRCREMMRLMNSGTRPVTRGSKPPLENFRPCWKNV